jgi:membrane protease YdiL (CAAX protease family)
MKDRLLARDYRFIAICLALLAATTWFSVRNFYRAFPEASIDFRVNRDQAESLAFQFLAQQGYHAESYRHAASFTFDDTAKTFLEREAGLEQANQMMGTRVRLWRWSNRWFRPQQKEEFRTEITPRGETVGFSHEIAEDAARPAIPSTDARTLAENFLRTRMQRDPGSLDFVEGSEVARPHRTDRVYTWKERDFNFKDAVNRVEVTLLGNEVAGYREYLKVPDQWTRDYQRLRSKNEVASTVDTAVMVGFLVGLIVVIVIRVGRHDVRWRRAAFIGIAAMALSFCAYLNQLPLQEFDYPTTDSYSSFMARQLLNGIFAALGAGGFLFILTAGAEPLYRESYGSQISLGNLFRPRGLRTKRFFLGSILGISLTGIFIAYQTAFYMTAYRFGAWSPADVPYSDLLNTKFPWAFVLFGGFFPAVSEEFLFRMFGIPFLRKLLRWLPAAVILAGFIWGFGHSAYPQQPFYIRGVEVGIGGVALGLIMLRWGILPTLVWHYSVDAMYSAMLLLRSPSLYFKLSGAASAGIIVLPVLIALAAYWKNGGFEPVDGLLNADEEKPAESLSHAEPQAETQTATPHMLAARTRLAAVVLCVLGLLVLLIPVNRLGDSPAYRIADDQAAAASDAFLRAHNLDPAPYRHVTFPAVHWNDDTDDDVAGKYFLERRPVPAVSALFAQNRPIQHWVTRYFKSLDKEELLVSVHPETAKVLAFHHTLPEDRPGADLTEDAARQVASVLAGELGLGVGAMELKESRSEKKKARRDHTFVWEALASDPRNVDEARFRVEAEVDGDQPASLRSYWKLPEAYSRARSRRNALSIVVATLRFGALSGAVVGAILLLIQNIRKGLIRWKRVILFSIPIALLTAVSPLLSMRLLLQNYQTAIPLETFQAVMYMVVLMSVVFGFLVVAAAAALLDSFYPASLAAFRAASRRVLSRDAIFVLLAAIGLALLSRQARVLLMDRFHAHALYSFGAPNLLVSASPALAAVCDAIRSVLVYGAMLGAIALIWNRLSKPWMKPLVFMALAVIGLPLDIRTPAEFALHVSTALLGVAAAAVFCFWFARRNYLAYALTLFLWSLTGPILELAGNPNPRYQFQFWILLAVAALAIIAVLTSGTSRPAPVSNSP